MAMVKVVSPSGWDFDCAVAAMVKVSADGRIHHNDKLAFVKRAGALGAAPFDWALQAEKFGKDEVPVHLIALGAKEVWGSNRNGDAFTEETLKQAHDTFVKYAFWFRNHKNKAHDGHPKYGLVKASAYNPVMRRVELLCGLPATKEAAVRLGTEVADKEVEKLARDEDLAVSMACFLPGTPVSLPDGTELPIDQIPLGTDVVTHHGNVGVVDQRMTRQYDGDLVRFRASGLPDDVVSTSNHKIWVRPSLRGKTPMCPVCNKQFKGLRAHLRQQTDPQHQAACADYGRYAEGWVRAEHVAVGDYVRTPFSAEVSAAGDVVYAELLGFYLSDGNTFHYRKSPKQDGVDFSFAKTEQHLVDRVLRCLTLLGYARVRVYDRKNNVRLVRATSPELASKLEHDAGRYSHGKRLAPCFMTWSPAVQLRLLGAFMDGDGHFHKIHQSLIATTVSRVLAFQLAAICWRNGIPARIAAYAPKAKRRSYTVVVQESHVAKVPCDKTPADFAVAQAIRPLGHMKYQAVGTTWVGTSSITLAYVETGFVYRRVIRTSREPYCGPVHNIAVTVDSSYVVNGVAVSNCRVPYDVCSGCRNKARTREEYCKAASCKYGGCHDNLTKLVKMGHDVHHLHVENPHPTFFDISNVFRPADRIAYAGRADWVKAASADGAWELGGAKLAADLGVTAPPVVAIAHDVAVAGPALEAVVKVAHGLAAMMNCPDLHPGPSVQRAFGAIQPPVDLHSVGLTTEKTAGAGFAYLADRKIVLPLKDFAWLTKHAAGLEGAVARLPGAYARMIEDGTLVDRLAANPYAPTEKTATATCRSAVDRIYATHSLDPDAVDRRSQLAVIRGLPEPSLESGFYIEKVAADSGPAEELARAYACYQAAALARIAAIDDRFPLTAATALCQNQTY